jgi:hypothetical protein
MISVYSNHWLKKLFLIFVFIAFMMSYANTAAASAISDYKKALEDMGYTGDAQKAAEDAVQKTIDAMENSQLSIEAKYDELANRVDSMNTKDTRKDDATKELGNEWGDCKSTCSKVKTFTGLNRDSHVIVETQIGGVPPRVVPDPDFLSAEKEASDALNAVNRILIAPNRPGNVPEGDVLEDFAPQIVRQLFRFAWLAVFISMVVSGVMFIISFDNEERLSRAKRMIYFTLLGFAFVSLAFAIVKGITDIDFFGFI